MSILWWLVLYFLAGIVCYIALCVWLELSARAESGTHARIDIYIDSVPVIGLWPLGVTVLLLALLCLAVVAGVRWACEKCADMIENMTMKSVTLCESDEDANVCDS